VNHKPLLLLNGKIKSPPFSEDARRRAGFLLRMLQRGELLSLPHYHYHTITTTLSLPHYHYHTITTTLSLPHYHYHTITTTLSLPHSRPMPVFGPRCHELRIIDSSAQVTWRIIYRLDVDYVVIVDIFAKKTERTTDDVIWRCKARLKRYEKDRR